jgi:hypothetical protein
MKTLGIENDDDAEKGRSCHWVIPARGQSVRLGTEIEDDEGEEGSCH